MPSILFHELVGYKIASKYKKYELNDRNNNYSNKSRILKEHHWNGTFRKKTK